jgi:hypothetical protein
MDKNNIYKILSFCSIAVIGIGIGFFFGQKYKGSQNPNTATPEEIAKIAKTSKEEIKIIEKTVPEVYFFKLDENRICPKEYVIKAKFGTDTPVFYTSQNKLYGRVKPELCFASKEKAIEKGFVEKK